MFKFGNSGRLSSIGKYTIPVVLAGRKGTIEIDTIDSDFPLLLSKKAMKAAKMKIDLVNDTVEVLGKMTTLVPDDYLVGALLLAIVGREGQQRERGLGPVG